ncbi:MAG: response regulator transcription factor, partial [Kiritimatiellae bacterium]|nr:response regulator transcription factor [Kiritimatiellia bacterium]
MCIRDRIKVALRRAGRLYGESGEECTIGETRVDFRTRVLCRGKEKARLTRYETDLLRLLARQRGEVVSRARILEEVWKTKEDSEGNRTVDNYIARLRSKIEPDPSNPRYILTVRGVGYKLL